MIEYLVWIELFLTFLLMGCFGVAYYAIRALTQSVALVIQAQKDFSPRLNQMADQIAKLSE